MGAVAHDRHGFLAERGNNQFTFFAIGHRFIRDRIHNFDHEMILEYMEPFLPFAGRLEFALEKLGADRILYGTDLVIRDIPAQLGRILGAEMSATDRDKILYANAAKLLGLPT